MANINHRQPPKSKMKIADWNEVNSKKEITDPNELKPKNKSSFQVLWLLVVVVIGCSGSSFQRLWLLVAAVAYNCILPVGIRCSAKYSAPHDRVSGDRVSSKRHFGGSSWYDMVKSISKMSFWRGREGHFRSHSNPIKHLPLPQTPLVADITRRHIITTLVNSSFAPVRGSSAHQGGWRADQKITNSLRHVLLKYRIAMSIVS